MVSNMASFIREYLVFKDRVYIPLVILYRVDKDDNVSEIKIYCGDLHQRDITLEFVEHFMIVARFTNSADEERAKVFVEIDKGNFSIIFNEGFELNKKLKMTSKNSQYMKGFSLKPLLLSATFNDAFTEESDFETFDHFLRFLKS